MYSYQNVTINVSVVVGVLVVILAMVMWSTFRKGEPSEFLPVGEPYEPIPTEESEGEQEPLRRAA